MAINFSTGFDIRTIEAIDRRFVLSKHEMLNERYEDGIVIPFPGNYFCVCKDDGQMYTYNSKNTRDPIIGKFRPLATNAKDDRLPDPDIQDKGKVLTVGDAGYELEEPASGLAVDVVEELPTEDIDPHALYLVPKQDPSSPDDLYDEYLYVDGKWDKIGSTDADLSDYVKFEDLSPVATTGDYNDLTNKPTIPSATSELDNDSGFITENDIPDPDWSDIQNKPEFATIATTGDYNDLLDKPAIPTATSELTNDSGFVDQEELADAINVAIGDLPKVATTGNYDDLLNKPTIPTTTSELENDSGFVNEQNLADAIGDAISDLSEVATSGDYNDLLNKPTIPTATSELTNDSGFVDQEELAQAISDVNQFQVEIVEELPEEDIDLHTIYFVPKEDPSGQTDGYDEYIYINEQWEKIGNTSIDLSNYVQFTDLATVATSGSYNDLNNKPTIPAAQVNSDWNSTSGVSQILNKPTIPAAQVNSDWNATEGVAEILNKPTIPAAQVNSDWNSTSGVSQILNKPTIPAAQVNSDWNATEGVAEILNKPTIPAAQVNSDWNSTSGVSQILNKPTIPQEGTVVPVVQSGVTIAVIDNTPIYAPEGITNVELNDLDDVEISDPQDHQTLTYDATSDKWVNSTASSSAVVSQVVNAGVPLAVIDDTIIYSPYDDVTKINGAIAIIANDSFELSTKGLEVYWDGTLEYSTDKLLWTTWDGTAISSNNAGMLYLRGSNNTVITGNDLNAMWQITTNASEISCLGNIENLLDYQSVSQSIHPTMAAYCFYNLFFGWVNLVEGPELPATSLAAHCYDSMFENCSALIKAPELPSTVLAEYCYAGMFYDCASLKVMPSLPATTLANSCYFSMFNGCTALKEINELPATVLADSCYTYMFKDCSSLVNAMDSLPATALTFDCYRQMFYGCSALKSAPAIAATTLTAGLNVQNQQSGCCVEMFKNCTALEMLPVLAPVLLADYSYMNMFNGCSKIKLSTSKVDDYTLPYRLPYIGQGVNATDALTGMFANTAGTFVGTPSINTTYYTQNILVYPDSHKIYPSGQVTWNAASLIFDSVPTEGSMNPVTSDGIYQAIQEGGGGGGASALVDLTDTSISSPTNGQVLTYNSADNKWKNLAVPQSTQVNSDWNSSSGVSEILNKPTIPQEGTVVQLLQTGTPIAIIDGITIYAPTPSSGS